MKKDEEIVLTGYRDMKDRKKAFEEIRKQVQQELIDEIVKVSEGKWILMRELKKIITNFLKK